VAPHGRPSRGPWHQKRLSRAHITVPVHNVRARGHGRRGLDLWRAQPPAPPLPLLHFSLAMLGKECPALPILDHKCPNVASFPCSMRISGARARATRCMRKECRRCSRRTTTYPQFENIAGERHPSTAVGRHNAGLRPFTRRDADAGFDQSRGVRTKTHRRRRIPPGRKEGSSQFRRPERDNRNAIAGGLILFLVDAFVWRCFSVAHVKSPVWPGYVEATLWNLRADDAI
jgi:hypothetical protein